MRSWRDLNDFYEGAEGAGHNCIN
ncbi:hypothetical protein FPSE_01355 [Fusarium pseudograminearum CS3096]|uniref:Uncharacterized protein n=1 Tax=Fusarium pseudograminearum (strain CS3096) TaxID=1028729 RepID=K3VS39_FUSPC|nr:hypothetical protein FPSE_01355 [Fusarium pseudograminearum CS3096]EKJ78467.1 hypothetical protein FPSE_01355 [Fusarium pseudograminearum CS3096]